MTTELIESRPETENSAEEVTVSMPDLRLELTMALVLGAIRRYDETLATRRAISDVAPKAPRRFPRLDFSPEEVAVLERAEAEMDAWKLLCDEAGSDFDSAERALAERIQALYDALATGHDPERGSRPPHGGEVAVKVGDTTYILASDSNDYAADSNLIAIVKDAHILMLDGPATP